MMIIVPPSGISVGMLPCSDGWQDQDKFSALSHEKAARAREQGLFKDEIVPVS